MKLLFFKKNRLFVLLITLLSYLVIGPIFSNFLWIRAVMNILLTFTLLSSLYAVSLKKWTLMVAGLLFVPVLILTWVPYIIENETLNSIHALLNILFIIFVALIILNYVFRENEITREVISGSVVVFLMLAMLWSYIYELIETFSPGSFTAAFELDTSNSFIFIYYSFVTITTLGYGDMSPATDTSRSFAVLEAVVGQLYMTILVARLVGINISQWLAKKRP